MSAIYKPRPGEQLGDNVSTQVGAFRTTADGSIVRDELSPEGMAQRPTRDLGAEELERRGAARR